MRRCRVCGKRKPSSEFSRREAEGRPFSTAGHTWVCDECEEMVAGKR